MTDHREADRREDALTPDERIRHLTLVVRWARTRHAKAVETLSNEVEVVPPSKRVY